jgi:hypothetical protein
MLIGDYRRFYFFVGDFEGCFDGPLVYRSLSLEHFCTIFYYYFGYYFIDILTGDFDVFMCSFNNCI